MISPTLAKYIDDCMWRDLLSWRDMWFGWLSLSTKAVVVGLFGEAPELFWDIRAILKGWNFRRKFRFSLPEGHATNWVKVLAFIGWIFIVVGVAGEWESEIRVGDADASLQDFISANLTDAQKETARALAFASVNELEAAKLSKDAEKLKGENLKLQALIQPRTIGESDRAKLGEQLRKFASSLSGRKVKISSQMGDAEGLLFCLEIMDILNRAGIEVDTAGMGRLMVVGTVQMGAIVMGPPRDAAWIRLLVLGLDARLNPPSVDAEFKAEYTEVTIMVGVKPIVGMPKQWLRRTPP
jgi:hypothetical protein